MFADKVTNAKSLSAPVGLWGLFKLWVGWMNYTSQSTFYYSELQLVLGALMALAAVLMFLEIKFGQKAVLLALGLAAMRTIYGFWAGKGFSQLLLTVIAIVLAYLVYRFEIKDKT